MRKECPLCGEMMVYETRETISRIPGSPQEVRNVVREWVCRECDYFEEADEIPRAEQ
jgi:hypothetical protein